MWREERHLLSYCRVMCITPDESETTKQFCNLSQGVKMHPKKDNKKAVRNFVAKHSQESGAGRHKDRKNDYSRQPKHRNQKEVYDAR